MGFSTRAISRVGGRRVVAALGVLYVVLGVGKALRDSSRGAPLGDVVIMFVLIAGPGLVLAYWGRRLARTDVEPELYATVACWCLGAIAAMLGILLLYHLQPGDGLTNPAESVFILTALASVAGLGIGVHDAHAKTRAREAERHSRELERQNDRLESFAGMLAHELRNPLSIAQIYHSQERPRDEDAAEEVERALDRIEEMIDVLLITVRAPDTSVDTELVALADVAVAAWADVSGSISGDGERSATDSTGPANDRTGDIAGSGAPIDDSTEIEDLDVATERTIMADPVHIEHLLRNLFRNSFEHADDGDVTVRIGDLDSGFYVEDDGPGIPEDVREDVVEAGFTTKSDGIGLGLTFVAQLAEMYGWEYAITESESGGARFEFRNVERTSPEPEAEPSWQ